MKRMLRGFPSTAAALLLGVTCIGATFVPAAAAPFAYIVQGPEDPRLEDPSVVIPIIDMATNTRVGSIPVPRTLEDVFVPAGIDFAPDAKLGYIAGANTRFSPSLPDGYDARGQVRIIDTAINQFLPATIDLPSTAPNDSEALFVEVTPDGRFIYVVSVERGRFGTGSTTYRLW